MPGANGFSPRDQGFSRSRARSASGRKIPMRRGIHTVAAVIAAARALSFVPGASADTGHGPGADIRYTEYGIPHITAGDFTGLGYGFGYAAATDNVCELAKIYLTVDAQRSRYLG